MIRNVVADLRSEWTRPRIVHHYTEHYPGRRDLVLHFGRAWVLAAKVGLDAVDIATGHRWCMRLQLRQDRLMREHATQMLLPITDTQLRLVHADTLGEGPEAWSDWLS